MKLGGERFVVGLADGRAPAPTPARCLRADVAAEHLGLDARRRRALREAEPRPQRLAIGVRVAERLEGLRAKSLRLLEQLVEIERRRRRARRGRAPPRRSDERLQRREGAIARLAHQRRRLALVDDPEMRRGHWPRTGRAAAAARRRREGSGSSGRPASRSCARTIAGRRRAPAARACRRRSSTIASASASSSRLVHSASVLKMRRRHIGGRRLGEGEAENLRRRRAVEQQPQHALRQDMRLAAAGVGGNPGRAVGSEARA